MRSWLLRPGIAFLGFALLPACDLDEPKNIYAPPAGPPGPGVPWTFVLLEAIGDARPPRFAAVLDLDGDFVEDLVLGRASSAGEATVYLGVSPGVYTSVPSFTMPLPADTRAGVVVDLDDDDVPDLVVGTFDGSGGGRMVLHRGLGDGSFGPAEDLAMQETRFLAAGDLDDDGTPDLAAGDGTLTNLYSNVGGVLTWIRSIPESGGMACADLDPSPGVELVAASGTVLRVYSDLLGAAGVTATLPLPGIQQATSVTLSDADGDSDSDVIVSTSDGTSGRVVLFRNSGSGFGAGESLLVGNPADGAAVVDLDGDAFPDLVLVRNGGATLGTALGAPGGTFVESASERALGAPTILLQSGPGEGGRGSVLLAMASGFFLGWNPPAP